MPVYEYRCKCCGREFEIRASIPEYSKGLEPVCPECGARECERLISLAAILGDSTGRYENPRGGGSGPCCGS